jgi:hypothetical protein
MPTDCDNLAERGARDPRKRSLNPWLLLVVFCRELRRFTLKGLGMLASLTTWLGQFPSMLFLLGYLLIIPAFAFIYGKLPSDFYNQTARLEPQVVWQRTAVENDLAARFAVENPAVVSRSCSRSRR